MHKKLANNLYTCLSSELGILTLLTLAVATVRVWLAIHDGGPTLFFDEGYYLGNARSLFTLEQYSTGHYPPLYSMLIAPGLFAGNWYPVIMAMSAFVSAAVVPATWLLAKSVGLKQPLIAAALVALLPSGAAYATFLMSENLSTSLFVVATALAIRGRTREGPLLGLCIAAVYLTKYLFLPAVPLLVLFWLLRVWQQSGKKPTLKLLLPAALRVAVPIVLMVAAWLIYALLSGVNLTQAVGLGDPTETLASAGTDGGLKRVVMWTFVASGVLALPIIPVLFLSLVYFVSGRRDKDVQLSTTQKTYAWMVGVFAMVSLAVVVQHTAGAGYNIPDPHRIWGRYLMHMTPLLIAFGLVLLQALLSSDRKKPWQIPVVAAFIASLGVAFGYWALFYRGWLFNLPRWTFSSPLVAADVFPMRDWYALILMLVVTAVITTILFVKPKNTARYFVLAAGCWIAVHFLVTINFIRQDIPVDRYTADNADIGGSLVRKLFGVVQEGTPYFFVLADGLAIEHMGHKASFWGVDGRLVRVVTLSETGLTEPGEGQQDKQLTAGIVSLPACQSAAHCYLVVKYPRQLAGERLDDRWGQAIRLYPVN